MPLIPGSILIGENGIPFNSEYGDVYHSADGALEQSREVFLKGCGLPDGWQEKSRFVILETGFGLGLNFLSTWQAFKHHPGTCSALHFISVEKHPLSIEALARCHAAWPELAELASALRRQWPVLVAGYHRLCFDGGRVQLTLIFDEAEAALKQLGACVNAIYLDGFSPVKNPDIWSPVLLKQLSGLCTPDARLATWCVAGAVRQGLQEAGFTVERKPGFGRKKERLEARLRPHSQREGGWAKSAMPVHQEKSATLIGAGIAGACLAHALTKRGWQVTLIEKHDGPAKGASGNPAGVVRPQLAMDESFNGRLSRQTFLQTVHVIGKLCHESPGASHEFKGVLQLARNADQISHMQAMLAGHQYPETFVRWVSQDEAGELAGMSATAPGLFFPQGGWMAGPRICEWLLADSGPNLTRDYSRAATRLERSANNWQVWENDTLLSESPVVVLTGAHEATQLVRLPLTPVRGQITSLPDGALPDLKIPITREGYVLPTRNGIGNIGGSFAFEDDDVPREADQFGNLQRLSRLLQHPPELDASSLGARVSFRAATPDRMPLVGAIANELDLITAETPLDRLSRHSGLYALTGLGARGLGWGPFLAQALAAKLDNEPGWLPHDLWRAIDPARFVLRDVRRRMNR